MIPYMGCEAARERIEAFVDEELSVDEQVAVETHLRWCQTCAARLEDLQLIGGVVRGGAIALRGEDDERRTLTALSESVLMRIRAEQDQSFTARARDMFSDRRLLWPALGASVAVLICLAGMSGVMQLARAERPDSLAAMLGLMADPGSDENPMRLDSRMSAPRALDSDVALDAMPEEEALFALTTVVTREGRVANYELLEWQRGNAWQRRGGATNATDVSALLDAVKRSRFEPAQGPNGRPVAVNMVWLIARTTVKGSGGTGVDLELPVAKTDVTVAEPKRSTPTLAPTGTVRRTRTGPTLPTA